MSDRPPAVAVIAAAIFRVRNIAMFVGAALVAKVVGAGFIAAALVGGVAYAVGIAMSANDRAFLAQVQENRRPLMSASDAPARIAAPALTGKHRASFDRVAKLKDAVDRDARALTAGPLAETLAQFLPQLDDVVPEVGRLLAKAQKAEQELGGSARKNLESELKDVEGKLAAATDPEAKQQLEVAANRKREALRQMDGGKDTLARIEAQVEAIASSLQEAHVRLTALSTNPENADASPAREAVEGISRDVKFLAQAVQETEQLLAAPASDMDRDRGRSSRRI